MTPRGARGARRKPGDALARFAAIDRLDVGPIRLEPRRLIAPYSVTVGGATSSYDLIYRYEERVFEPQEPSSLNLAAMIASQVALNYGLFCREIVFHGPYEEVDTRFLADMAENTAREIYVNKLLAPNPFLIGSAVGLTPQKRASYLQARLRFDRDSVDVRGQLGAATSHWRLDRRRHAVLSSGGKDSLASFGILRELQLETHPIFINESGRHWFTALNAYRHFDAVHPSTARVWTNADRLFVWMLGHLPFVRSDFDRIRADIYPIRLWTVAVFLFGALPLLRKREIGRLVIGDEYDTTVRQSTHDISHYGGLYDQSRYFDNAMTRFFARKGWGATQFSILRPLSEFLIQKVLAERYPDLQRHQMSCHMAHSEEQRLLPCGRCEKCRRIVSLLSAIGADPTACGYTREQIEAGLAAFARKGAHAETPAVEHVAALLHERGLWPETDEVAVKPRIRPEIGKIRIDAERSPFHAIPNDLREPIFRILLEHAAGAAEKKGRNWIDSTPLRDPAFRRPYPFESPPSKERRPRAPEGSPRKAADSHILGELTWPRAKARLKRVDIALLPVGALEQHGPHLPLDTDAFDAEYLARRVADACARPRPFVLPLIPYGVSYHHEDFSGTISVTNETLAKFVHEVGVGAARNGINKLVIINGHGGNAATLQFAAQMINRDAHIFTCVDTGETSDADIDELADTPNDVHAGEIETSTTLAIRPQMVEMDKARKFVPRFSSRYLDFSSRRSLDWNARTANISPTGVLGDPTKASAEKGERFWEIMVKHLVELVEHLKTSSLDEIYQRRY